MSELVFDDGTPYGNRFGHQKTFAILHTKGTTLAKYIGFFNWKSSWMEDGTLYLQLVDRDGYVIDQMEYNPRGLETFKIPFTLETNGKTVESIIINDYPPLPVQTNPQIVRAEQVPTIDPLNPGESTVSLEIKPIKNRANLIEVD